MKKKILVMLLTVTMGISLLVGCGEGAKTETGAEVEISEENTEPEVMSSIENAEEVVEETTGEKQERVEKAKILVPDNWIESLELTEITPIIWNYYTGKGTIISEMDVYTMQENDRLFIFSKKQMDSILSLTNDIIIGGKSKGQFDGYIYLVEVNTSKETEVKIQCSIEGEEYIKTFNILRTDFIKEDTSTLTGHEWIQTLGEEVECPSFLIWNDETGTKSIIENGGEYIWQEGDNIAVYTNNMYSTRGVEQVDITIEVGNVYDKLEFDQSLLKEKQELKVVLMSEYDTTLSEIFITLIKPTE